MAYDSYENVPVSSPPPPAPRGDTQTLNSLRPVVWPGVLGAVSIVASFFVLAMSFPFAIGVLVSRSASRSLASFGGSSSSPPAFLSVVVVLIGLVLAVWLCTNGVGMIRRRSWVPRSCIIWAVAMIASTGVVVSMFAYFQYRMMTGIMDADGGELASAAGNLTIGSMVTAQALIGLALGASLPIFFLFWFRETRVKADVATWA